MPEASPREVGDLPDDDSCDMVTNAQVYLDDEVYNTYDSTLSNAHLLCQYGFMLDGNSNDVVTWTVDEVQAAIEIKMEGSVAMGDMRRCLDMFDPFPSAIAYQLAPPGEGKHRPATEFTINSEGLLSGQLLAILVAGGVHSHDAGMTKGMPSFFQSEAVLKLPIDRIELLFSDVAELLSRLSFAVDSEDEFSLDVKAKDDLVKTIALEVCAWTANLCSTKRAQIGDGSLEEDWATRWGEILDVSEPRLPKLECH